MEAFNACGPVLMMAIHIIAFNCLLHNPDALAEQSVKNAATEALRTNPSKQNVNQYLIDSILQKRRTVQRSTDNLWEKKRKIIQKEVCYTVRGISWNSASQRYCVHF